MIKVPKMLRWIVRNKVKQSELGEGAVLILDEDEAENIVLDFISFYVKLQERIDLKPSPDVNRLFEGLVATCVKINSSATTRKVLMDPRLSSKIERLRGYCAHAEFQLELYWTSKISHNSVPLYEFPYYSNYVDLSLLEIASLCPALAAPPSKIAFFGCGPLPLSSLCLLGILKNSLETRRNSHSPLPQSMFVKDPYILNFDRSDDAIEHAKKLCYNLGQQADGMHFRKADALSRILLLRGYQVVFLSALVGDTQEVKEALIQNIARQMDVGSLLVIRTAHGLRTILYSEFDPTSELVQKYLEICSVVHPFNHVVNSIIVARVKHTEDRLN